MSTLLLRLAGPMQSWGTDSKFDVRRTGREPSKSGVIGLVAAALGIARQDRQALQTLNGLRFGVRVDVAYVTHRYYLSDAEFVAGLESDDRALLAQIAQALQAPAFPLYLGRRSCPPVGRVFLKISDEPLEAALCADAPPGATRLVLDAAAGEPGGLVRDVPLSFDPARREYTYRRVTERVLHGAAEHDPMVELEDTICT